MATIQLQQALREMERLDERGRPVPFQIQFCTCDENRLTGGQLISYSDAVLARSARKATARSTASTAASSAATGHRAPDQDRHQTRNLSAVDSSEIRKVNIRLILTFNYQTVVW